MKTEYNLGLYATTTSIVKRYFYLISDQVVARLVFRKNKNLIKIFFYLLLDDWA
jgi:hypothetical protein